MYLVKLTNIHTDKNIESFEFLTQKEAKKQIRLLKKSHDLINHAGHLVNYSEGIEIRTNF